MHDPEQTTVILMLWPLLGGCSAAKKIKKCQWALKGEQNWSRRYMCLTVTIMHSCLSIKGLSPEEGQERFLPKPVIVFFFSLFIFYAVSKT